MQLLITMIASTPGLVFGPSNDYNLRINFNSPIPEIKIGLEHLSSSLSKLYSNQEIRNIDE